MFRSTTIIMDLALGVCVCVCALCVVQIEAQSAQDTQHTHHHGLDITCCHTTTQDVISPTTFINVTLARHKCKLPDYGRRPKHVGAVLICFNVNFSGL